MMPTNHSEYWRGRVGALKVPEHDDLATLRDRQDQNACGWATDACGIAVYAHREVFDRALA